MQGLGLLALSEGEGSVPDGPEGLPINCHICGGDPRDTFPHFTGNRIEVKKNKGV